MPAPNAAFSTVVPAGTVTSWPFGKVTLDNGVTSLTSLLRLEIIYFLALRLDNGVEFTFGYTGAA
jgi:hypothetical protein